MFQSINRKKLTINERDIFKWVDDLNPKVEIEEKHEVDCEGVIEQQEVKKVWLKSSIEGLFKQAKSTHDFSSGLSIEELTIAEMKKIILSQPAGYIRVRSMMGNFSRGYLKTLQREYVQNQGLFESYIHMLYILFSSICICCSSSFAVVCDVLPFHF